MTTCDLCPAAAEHHARTGAPVVCDCGTVHAPDDFRWPVAPAANDAPSYAAESRALPSVLHDLDLAARWAQRERERTAPPRCLGASSPLARLQGHATLSARDVDATERQVAGLWRMVTGGGDGRVATRAREGFVDSLLRYAEATQGPDLLSPEVDWPAAERCARRLEAMPHEARGALVALQRRSTVHVGWAEAARAVAEACAPRALVTAWAQGDAAPRRVGRPRRDWSQPTVDEERAAWGERVLARAVQTWIDGPTVAREESA